MNDRPSAEANHVLKINGITTCPAEHLQEIAATERIKVLFRSIDDEPEPIFIGLSKKVESEWNEIFFSFSCPGRQSLGGTFLCCVQ